uniref:Serine/threonine-protein phosphatase n=1 Tax=Albugo laibachii Nc14 TaxID=890382 RepID=F0WW70_9STRA|nr:calcineurinlike phosphoesterase putative [Albugo laibachii Nc14]|eukprot:CCA25689.1 calcineurinlike phosphoesterase putative [Albugo laibachii Nc14]
MNATNKLSAFLAAVPSNSKQLDSFDSSQELCTSENDVDDKVCAVSNATHVDELHQIDEMERNTLKPEHSERLSDFISATCRSASFPRADERMEESNLAEEVDTSQRNTKADTEAEGDAMLRVPNMNPVLSGNHHRRISTKCGPAFSFSRKTHEKITDTIVQHFVSGVPMVAISRSPDLVNETLQTPCAFHVEDIALLLQTGKTLPMNFVLDVVSKAMNSMTAEPNVIEMQASCVVVGDLHGQYQDLLSIFHNSGYPSPENRYLFLGDYVDRGVSSCEILLLLLAIKVERPQSIQLLRGNHECRSLSTFYGFRDECWTKYGGIVYHRFLKCFQSMPLAARIHTGYGTFLALHGGLSPDIRYVDDIQTDVNRFQDPEPQGALCDLLWSDPVKQDFDDKKKEDCVNWAANHARGCSYTFSERALREFLKENQLVALIRAHELEENGFREYYSTQEPSRKLPCLITVFSAPQYCNKNSNMGATLLIPLQLHDEDQPGSSLQFKQYTRSSTRENDFSERSEYYAMQEFLEEHIPFVPLDFHRLVKLCKKQESLVAGESERSFVIPAPLNDTKCASRTESCIPEQLTETNTNDLTDSSVDQVTSSGRIDDSVIRIDEDTFLNSRWENPESPTGLPTSKQPGNCEPEDHTIVTNGAKHLKKQKSKAWNPVKTIRSLFRSTPTNKNKPKQPNKTSRRYSSMSANTSDPKPTTKSSFVWPWKPKKERKASVSSVSSLLSMSAPAPSRSASFPARPTSFLAVSASPASASEAVPPRVSETVGKDESNDNQTTGAAGQCDRIRMNQGNLAEANSKIFTSLQWIAFKLFFNYLDINGHGIITEEGLVALLADQDFDAYATEEDLSVVMDSLDQDQDGLVTAHDFLLFAYRASLAQM